MLSNSNLLSEDNLLQVFNFHCL